MTRPSLEFEPPSATATVNAQQLWFTAPGDVAVHTQPVAAPAAGEVLVSVSYSAVSAGTELLVYRGEIPPDMALDTTLGHLQETPAYPLQYGYASVGRITQLGANVHESWYGRWVFAFRPHASHFVASLDDLIPLPDDIHPEDAIFLANMETAVNLVQDGSPGLGERVVILGQGIVGLLLGSVLTQFPLGYSAALDRSPSRRDWARICGIQDAFDPASATDIQYLREQLGQHVEGAAGADLIYEVSGAPEALDLAIELSGFASRIVIGSWYGNKTTTVALGGEAHRNRLTITTSQVSSIAPALQGRWTKSRRFELAWDMLRRVQPRRFISHRYRLEQAADLYAGLQKPDSDILQAIFTYAADPLADIPQLSPNL